MFFFSSFKANFQKNSRKTNVSLLAKNNFDELPFIIPKLTFVFCCFFSRFISCRSLGTKEMTVLHSFLAFMTISQRKRHYVVG